MAVMTGPLVLAADVEIAPVARLSARMRATLGARRGEYAITRPRGRASAKLVSQAGAALLAEFRAPVPVVQVVRGIADRDGRDAAELLDEAFPLLRDCFNARFLVAAGTPEAAPILPSRERGDTIGPYEVLRCLRVLEDSELHQVRDGTGRVLAVKLVRRHAAPAVSAALAREAAVLERLAGRGAPRLVARGRHRTRPWLAMRWCDGVAPEIAFGEVRERGATARAELLRLAVAVARAYARLHRAGILHGDVHPGNLLVSRSGEVTLLDFGLARPMRGSRPAGPRFGGRAGAGGVTEYFAPEQATVLRAGRPLPAPTAASEQYAVAAMLYRLLAGAPAIAPAPAREEMLRRIVESPVRRFSQAGAPPWPAVEAVLARALTKEPGGRYRGVAELARALRTAEKAGAAGVPRRRGNPLAGVVEEFIAAAGLPFSRSPALPLTAVRPPTCSLMLGGAGTGLALLRIACARSDPATLALADVWLTRVERDLGDSQAFEAPAEGLSLVDLGAASP
ncbi:MAG TPA: protein kinase, partial [Gemmatimonadales bacterium]|nr:protein kinase [Gemmatimonadales bacterium]